MKNLGQQRRKITKTSLLAEKLFYEKGKVI